MRMFFIRSLRAHPTSDSSIVFDYDKRLDDLTAGERRELVLTAVNYALRGFQFKQRASINQARTVHPHELIALLEIAAPYAAATRFVTEALRTASNHANDRNDRDALALLAHGMMACTTQSPEWCAQTLDAAISFSHMRNAALDTEAVFAWLEKLIAHTLAGRSILPPG